MICVGARLSLNFKGLSLNVMHTPDPENAPGCIYMMALPPGKDVILCCLSEFRVVSLADFDYD